MTLPCQQNIIGAGQFTTIHKLSDKLVRKVPFDRSYVYSAHAVQIEGRVYAHLGQHERIALCIDRGDDFLDLRYEPSGDLESFLKTTHMSDHAKHRIARQAIEAVAFIHSEDVIHSDLSARQFLVVDHRDGAASIRLSDFGGSSVQGSDALVMETATHFMPRDEDAPNSVRSDLFALGSTLYGIWFGGRPFEGREEEEVRWLFGRGVFPALEGVDALWGEVIRKCWMGEYDCASDILQDVGDVS